MEDKKLYEKMSLLEVAEYLLSKEIDKAKNGAKKNKKDVKETLKGYSIEKITKLVFDKKGLSLKDAALVAQFELDFMLCGKFIYNDEKGEWFLKYTQKSSLLDKDSYADPLENDSEVINNELKDDAQFEDTSISSDDDEDTDIVDEIQEELGLIVDDGDVTEEENEQFYGEEDENSDENDDVEDLSEDFN